MAARPTVQTLAAGARYDTSILTSNFTAIRDAFDTLLGLAGTSGTNNTITGDIDFAGNKAKNVTFDGTVVGLEWQGIWVTATAYAVNDLVFETDTSYICVEAHTSGTFATDLSANKWEVFASGGVTVTAYAATLLDDATASDALTTLTAPGLTLANTFSGANTFSDEINADGPLAMGDGSELTVASGSITPTANYHRVDTESDTSTDDLDTIDDANMQDGALLLLRAENTARTVVVKNGTGNHKLNLSGDVDYELDSTEKSILLQMRGGEWYELNRTVSGKVVQTVNTTVTAASTGTTVMPADDTIPQNTEGDEYMTLAITPTNTSNILIIEAEVQVSSSAAGNVAWSVALFQDSTADALAAMSQHNIAPSSNHNVTLRHYMTAGTTSATTFKIRIGTASSGTITFNGAGGSRLFGGVSASGITITEVTP